MKSLIALCVVTLAGSSMMTTAAFAQKSKREQAVATCIAKAQDQIKQSGNPNDPGYNNRYNVYASCMKQAGQKP